MKTPWLLLALSVVPACAIDDETATIDPKIEDTSRQWLPTGVSITPTAAPGARFTDLDPELAAYPEFRAGQPVALAVSPDGTTMLLLTSGYNRWADSSGHGDPAASSEYVFVYDIGGASPVKQQVLRVANTFHGIAWRPDGGEFYVTGGVDDVLHAYARSGGAWAEARAPLPLGHAAGLGLGVAPMAAGVAVTADGRRAVVASFENDSATIVDLAGWAVEAELELRPGKTDPGATGVPGGEFPFRVATRGSDLALVSSLRDREVIAIDLDGDQPEIAARITVGGAPADLLVDEGRQRLYVANANSDTVSVVDLESFAVVDEIRTAAPSWLLSDPQRLKGASPNGLALSPNGHVLYVTNGGTNSVAVVALGTTHPSVVGLIPTGWYPSAVAVRPAGDRLFVANAKSVAGPNQQACRDTTSIAPGSLDGCRAANQYVWQLTRGGLLTVATPTAWDLLWLSFVVASNNDFAGASTVADAHKMAHLRQRIQHVIYIVKENRTYDQVLGDLEVGDGEPDLNLFPEPVTPNHHALARGFVTLDRFFDSGGVSGDGWNWTTAARATDFTEKTVPVNYAGRGLTYDWEGTTRDVNVSFETLADRIVANPHTPADADLLPGTADVAAPEKAGEDDDDGMYLWDAALAAGLSVRNYGFFGDLYRYFLPATDPAFIPVSRHPYADGIEQFVAAKEALRAHSDPYFRSYDMKNADFWLFEEWAREFDQYVANGDLPALSLVRFPHDHFGDFASAIDGVNTPDTQMADNDYAIGRLVEKVANSRYWDSTVIFIIEDDAQNGADHVDAHRSIAYVVGAYVKQGAVVSRRYTTVNMVRTIEDLLGLGAMGLPDAKAAPMADVFEARNRPRRWSYTATVPAVLRSTSLPLPPPPGTAAIVQPRGDAAYWQRVLGDQDYHREDAVDTDRFNRELWRGLKRGAATPRGSR